MNIYKNLLFLHGYILDPKLADDDFGPTYGNRLASEKTFRERWQADREPGKDLPTAACVESADVAGCG